ncbi:uncharacterized protein EI90DRAFT_3077246 [Cantharellus anzutake]|uniref:uncharacterized protein n=1 Tax=Cantharellus anzutake TaxID=1750568 RepID=UPI001904FA3B|nr:uncharacterized protein EI90DRAFT_3077246 [Cantharellus anzutake]KAF8322890.1 hypothetical protein EI90DRAFT_3077246 [Cantharellus anzutake]
MVFEEFGSSFGRYEWTAHPWDSPKGLYDYVSSVVTPRLGSEEILRALSLYQMPDEDYVKLQEAGKLEPIQLRKTTTLLLDPEAPLWKIGLPNLIFAFTARRKLHIPYALFDGRPNSYQFVHRGDVEATSEDPVKFLHEGFRRSIRPKIPLGTSDYRIHVYEPREEPSSLQDLKLDDNFFHKSCRIFSPGKKLSEWEGRMLLVIFQIQSKSGLTSLVTCFDDMRLVNEAPSTIAKIESYRSIQCNTQQRILDDRPGKDKLIAPISLLYQPFGYFRDIRCGLDVPGEKDFPEDKLKEDVNAFANEMTGFFDNEDERRSKFIKFLEPILKTPPNSIKPNILSGSRKRSDGHLDGEHGAMVICIECKNELSSATCEPNAQLAAYIATSFAGQAEEKPELFQRWRVPALGVIHVGPTIQFFGVVWVGQVRVIPLTPSLPLTDPTGEDFRWDLLLAFKAAALVFSKIKSDIKDFLQVLRGPLNLWPHSMTIEMSRYPSVTEINVFPEQGLEKIEFILKSRFDNFEHRHLYHATLVSSNPLDKAIFVKFSQTYFKDLHAFCASKGLAPQILGFQQLHGGWYAVAMESINTKDHKHIKPSLPCAQEWKESICNLVNAFHDKNWVHGDLRPANFVFTNKRMLLEGKAKFPHEPLIEELGVSNDKLRDRPITKEHDLECLSKVLKWVDRISLGQ